MFYDRLLSVLGFDRIPSNDPYWLEYRKGRMAIGITVSQPTRVTWKAPHIPTDGVKGSISDHIAFRAPSPKRIAAIEKALRRRGYTPVYSTDKQTGHGPAWYASNAWKDPDNNVLEVYSVTRRRTER